MQQVHKTEKVPTLREVMSQNRGKRQKKLPKKKEKNKKIQGQLQNRYKLEIKEYR